MKKHEIEVWIAIDSDGTYEVGEAEDIALERFSENVGGVCRLVKLNVRIGGPFLPFLRGCSMMASGPGNTRAV